MKSKTLETKAAVTSKALLTIAEAAEQLRISAYTLRSWVGMGRIEHLRIGGRILFKAKTIDEVVERSCRKATAPASLRLA